MVVKCQECKTPVLAGYFPGHDEVRGLQAYDKPILN